MKGKKLFSTRDIATISVLSGVAALLFLWEIPIVLFYKLDFSNLPVLLGTFSMGPLAGSAILLVKSLIGLLHSTSQGVGELADFIIGLAMVWPAGLIYNANKSRKSALTGMLAGSFAATLAGAVCNLVLLIPFYSVVFNLPVDRIVAMGQSLIPALDTEFKFILFITAPFNLLKWLLISAVTFLVYKPLSPVIKGRK
ncbi:MAG: ECF transporter S component [Eubacteriales bacterium]|nr:ECF transporter S component [Eubacteriales bacterium]MDD3880884.1 ECF transporter S component [Eubacteriales bacterium]MDD4511749.1 ECF transporter S component [Eubacteriales bacterium]